MTYTDGIETPRLISRFLTHEDAAAWASFFTDPINCTFINIIDPTVSAEERAQLMIDFTLKRYQENRLGLQALIDKHTGTLIGMCGLLAQEVNGVPEVEVGYHLLRPHWGKGYASEAAQRFRDYGFENRIADSIVSIIHPLNFLSKNVAIRNGMALTNPGIFWRDNEVDLFRITRNEWEQLKK